MSELTENKEIIQSQQPDLVVDFVRHGEAEYSEEEYERGDLSGKLTDKGQSQTRESAKNLSLEIDPDELVVIWSSPKDRANETALIYQRVLKDNEKDVFVSPNQTVIQRDYLRDLAATKDGYDAMADDFVSKHGEDYSLWMKYWLENELPKGVETPAMVGERLRKGISALENLAHFSKVKGGKRLHLLIITHEEVVERLLQVGFNWGISDSSGIKNAERLRMNIFKSELGNPAKLGLQFRNQISELSFDPQTKDIQKVA